MKIPSVRFRFLFVGAIFWSNAHAWFYLGFMAKMKSMQKVLVNVFFARKEKKKSPETRNFVI